MIFKVISISILLSLFSISSATTRTKLPSCTSARFDTGDDWIVVENTDYVKVVSDDDTEDCDVAINALLIGAGGDTNTFLGHGGGSGYVTNQMITVTVPTTLSITVGRSGNFGSSGDSTLIEIYG